MGDIPDASPPPFYLGSKADLRRGDQIESGVLTSSLDAAAWEAEVGPGDGPGRIYVVEPTGPIEEEPDPARRKFPGPATMYRSAAPLRITDEWTDQDGRPPRFFHGTKADLRPGDLMMPGHPSNFGDRGETTAYVYLTGTLDAATWGAELAVGEGPGRIYVVEPDRPHHG